MVDSIKAWLYKILGLNNYLRLLQQVFFIGYKTGALQNDEKYVYRCNGRGVTFEFL